MIDALKAAKSEADSYESRNDGDAPHVAFIQACLSDALARAEKLEEFATTHEQEQAIRNAGDQLKAAQAAKDAPQPQQGVAPETA